MEWAQRARAGFEQHAPTARGQLVGIALIFVPALADALPLAGAGHGAIMVPAVLLGFVGTLTVFGGLLLRVLPTTGGAPTRGTPTGSTSGGSTPTGGAPTGSTPRGIAPARGALTGGATGGGDGESGSELPPSSIDALLDAVPRTPAARGALAGVAMALAAGTLWCLGLAITRGWADYLPQALMLGLPAATAGWAGWQTRPAP